jgi:hypothetical protein
MCKMHGRRVRGGREGGSEERQRMRGAGDKRVNESHRERERGEGGWEFDAMTLHCFVSLTIRRRNSTK